MNEFDGIVFVCCSNVRWKFSFYYMFDRKFWCCNVREIWSMLNSRVMYLFMNFKVIIDFLIWLVKLVKICMLFDKLLDFYRIVVIVFIVNDKSVIWFWVYKGKICYSYLLVFIGGIFYAIFYMEIRRWFVGDLDFFSSKLCCYMEVLD